MSTKKESCDHSHSSHSGHHHDHNPKDYGSIFKVGISLNLFFVLIELYYGYKVGSLSLISDAFHNLTDVFGLLVAWLGYYLTRKSNSKKYSLWASLTNTGFLILSSAWVIKEAVERFNSGHVPAALTMMTVAGIGCVINFTSAKLFHRDLHDDLNMKSAYMHLMADAAISLGVVCTGLIIYVYSIAWVDPVVSAVISIVIIVASVKIFRESIRQLNLQ